MKFFPYVCCGDPNLDFTYKVVKTLAPYSHIIELGIPFSDPIADGKTIQAAANRALTEGQKNAVNIRHDSHDDALKNGVNTEQIFEMVKKLRSEKIAVPFVFMTYYNIIYSYDSEKFLRAMNEANVQGLIIPDLPFGEDKEFEKLAEEYEISIINLIAPNTKEERAKEILNNEKKFTYLVSVAGTTGARGEVSEQSLEFVKKIRPLAPNGQLFVGFGISNAEQAKKFVQAGADGVIVGSEIINIYSKYLIEGKIDENKVLEEIEKFAEVIQSA